MAKHSKGKHAAGSIRKSRKAKKAEEASRNSAESIDEIEKQAEASEEADPSAADSAKSAEAADRADSKTEAGSKKPKHGRSKDDASGDSESKADSSDKHDASADADKTQVMQPVGAAKEDAGGSDDAIAASADETAVLGTPITPEGIQNLQNGFAMPAGAVAMAPVQAHQQKRGLKILGIVAGSIAIVLCIAYLAGVFFFSSHYLPNTTVAGQDISLKSSDEMVKMLDDRVGNYNFQVTGKGLNFQMNSHDAGISSDSKAAAQAILENTSPWAWPVEVFGEHDSTNALASALSAEGLSAAVTDKVAAVNSEAHAPVDAHLEYDPVLKEFAIIPEKQGTLLVPEAVMKEVLEGVLNLESHIVIHDESLAQPAVLADDKRLAKAQTQANELVDVAINIKMQGHDITTVNSDTVGPWISIGTDFTVGFDHDALVGWANDVANKVNTVGSTRTYTRPDGKVITVSGGAYGWEVDADSLANQIVDAVEKRNTKTIDIPVQQAGSGYTTLGGQDWGKRYLDVDISEQHVRFYDDSGNIIWETDFISGNPNTGHATPEGVWYVTDKQSPSTLIGEMRNGTPEYRTTVQYWMPFEGNAVGFHDATWQSGFGGSRYQSVGSHGCINLSYSDAEALYGIINYNDVVVVHS